MSGSILHTDMPLMPLSLLVAENARVEVDTANAGTEGACYYGWGEARNGSDCKPHHLVFVGENPEYLFTIGETLIEMGYQVVITDYDEWSVVVTDAPIKYDDHHQH